MSQQEGISIERAWAMQDYVMDSGRTLMIEVDREGVIRFANSAFRSRFSGFERVAGESLWDFLAHAGDGPELLAQLPPRTPVSQVWRTRDGAETYLFSLYRLEQGALLIGEFATGADAQVIERMSHLSSLMSRLVRELRQSNQQLVVSNEQNKELARTDALTGLANRRYFMERLEGAFHHARTRGSQLSVLALDLDHFKRVNDRFGHAGGDAVLVAVADLFRASTRVGDLAGRLGGEEFGVFLPDTAPDAACALAERIRQRLEAARPLPADEAVTCSVGVAGLTGETEVDQLLHVADVRLYRAKSLGRNRVVGADD